MIQIIQTADIVYVQYLENIVNTHRAFHVRGLRVHHKAGRTSVTGREQEEFAVTRMLHRIVLICQMTIQHLEADRLTPLQFLQQRNTVENLTVQIPRYIQRGVTVVQELHIINQVESLALQDIRQVGRRHNQQRERNFVPLRTAFHEHINLTP